ncbi:toll/interleukin-1 receptor domain-containing protein [Bradyrhizobium sp. OK095]|uniref:toll/interleukin-1 receptor domain-containing protein n=1 Tax=Bradyrhizobium sp. OK095 TaxID=1882760 RepID=UPI0008D71790|nr:toll/interleukin-1 receptor domain-containing protein [Bradyrhizobium sp. OK095]SEO17693.1 TIR domain-containing protein [Bradyrhizobium sp. OK095]
MLAFMSYQTADREIAAGVAQLLDTLGVQSFMAHEHIEVSVEWRGEILRQLSLADLFVPILSQRYYASIWCKQESGIAAFRRMTLIPLSIDGSIPEGFISHVQSSLLQGGQATYHQLMRGVASANIGFAIDAGIRLIAGARSFRQAEYHFEAVRSHLNGATDQQIIQLLTVSAQNGQVCHASLCAREYLPPLMQSHGHLLPPDVREGLVQVLAQYANPPPIPR